MILYPSKIYFHFRNRFPGITIPFIFIFWNSLLSCTGKPLNMNMKVSRQQIPVLVNVQGNQVMVLEIRPEDPGTYTVNSISLSLKGSTLADIKAISVFISGENGNPDKQYGETLSPAMKLVFKEKTTLSDTARFKVMVELVPEASLYGRIMVLPQSVNTDRGQLKTEMERSPNPLRIALALRRHMDDDVHTYRIPGLATTPKGTLLAVYDVRRDSSRDLQGDMDIGLSRSIDGGRTWEPMRIVLDMNEWGGLPEKFNGVSDACILVDKSTNDIYVAGLWMHGVLDQEGKWIPDLTEDSDAWEHQWRGRGSQSGFDVKKTSQFLITKSTDDGVTWSEPRNLTRMCKKEEWWLWAPAPGQGITLSDGTLVFPTQGRDENGQTFSNLTFSVDGGENWETSSPAFKNTTENMVVQLANGDLMLNARYNLNRNNPGNDNGRVVVTTSDLGQTWTEHPTSRSALIESTCMASLHKHVYHENGVKKSILLFSNPNTKTGRNHMTIKVSFDDGLTWPEGYWMLLDEGNSRGYSCITSIDENTIGILYEGSRADMVFESIPLREILDPDTR